MKNSIICPTCTTENPSYVYICKKCKSFLRERIYNIDLWKIIGLLIENPKKAFQLIVYSEHKNFIFFIILFVAIKFLINARFLSMFSLGDFIPTTGLYLSYFLALSITALYLFLFSLFATIINKKLGTGNRLRDNIAVLTYSLLPNALIVIFLIIIELAVFGEYLFSVNPTPFVIKGFIAYMFAGAEILLILWTMFLTFVAFIVQTNSILSSLIYTIIFYGCLSAILYFASMVIFTI